MRVREIDCGEGTGSPSEGSVGVGEGGAGTVKMNGGDARRFISLKSDSSYASRSTTVKVRYMGLKRHIKVRFCGGRERI